MKFSKSFYESIALLILLGVQKDHSPISSDLISQKMKVSNTYLKKTIRKLVTAHLVTSQTGKNGGICLKKQLNDISLLDVYKAIENEDLYEYHHLGETLFLVPEIATKKEEQLYQAFSKVQEDFYHGLKKITLSSIFENEDYLNGYLDWKTFAQNKKEDNKH